MKKEMHKKRATARSKSNSSILSSPSVSSQDAGQKPSANISCVKITDSSSDENQDEGANQSSASAPSQSATIPTSRPKRSWIWTHFEMSNDPNYAVCQVHHKNGKICGSLLKKDRSGSTKNFHEHLAQIYNMKDPKQPKCKPPSFLEFYKMYFNLLPSQVEQRT